LMKRLRNVSRTLAGRRPISVVSAATGHPVRGVVAMLKAQITVDESLQLTAFRSVLDRRVRVMCQLLQTLLESRNEQLLLAAEVPVKPAVRKAKVAHKSSDGRPFRPSASESP